MVIAVSLFCLRGWTTEEWGEIVHRHLVALASSTEGGCFGVTAAEVKFFVHGDRI